MIAFSPYAENPSDRMNRETLMKKTYDSKFKSRVALEALRGELTIAEIASKYQIHPNQVQRWKQRLMEGASDIFASSSALRSESR